MGSGCSTIPADKHIVIVGAGYGGAQLGRALLKKNAKFTIIDSKDAFHHNVASIRAVVDQSYAGKMFIPYEPTFGNHFRRGKVTRIDVTTKTVYLEGGESVTYDVLVIATGSTGPMKEWLVTKEEGRQKYSKYPEAVKASEEIVIVGGGAVGVEIAAEIGEDFPGRKVTIIHSSDTLISPSLPNPKMVSRVKEILAKFKVNVVYGEKVENIDDVPSFVHGSYELRTDKGATYRADLVIKATGLKPNSAAYADSLGASVTPQGALKVDNCLQVEGCPGVFAIGDCTNHPTPKLAFVAALHADYLLENLPKYCAGEPMQLWSDSVIKFSLGLSLGRNHGVGATAGGWMIPEFLLVKLKCQDMGLARCYGIMNQPLPK